MQHLGTVRIETERLILRRFTLDDCDAVFANWTSDPRVTEFLCWPTHETVETTKRVLSQWVERYAQENYYQWAIVPRSLGDEPIGTISVVEQEEALSALEIGYCIGRPWWGRGITGEALAGILPFLFQRVGANRVAARHDPNNPNSGRVMAKCGLKYEGTLRQADRNNRGVVDAAVYSMLADEYAAGK